jgi:hypothetical protein
VLCAAMPMATLSLMLASSAPRNTNVQALARRAATVCHTPPGVRAWKSDRHESTRCVVTVPTTVRPTSNVSLVRLSVGSMPRISEFYGITILMFFGDHNPPHFHVRYAGHTARVALGGTVLAGSLPRRAARLVMEWAELHADELEQCWERAVKHEPPGTIDPLP